MEGDRTDCTLSGVQGGAQVIQTELVARQKQKNRAVPFCLSLISAAFQGLVNIRLAKKSVAPRLDPWSRIVPYYS
jgi:hypothetical protein